MMNVELIPFNPDNPKHTAFYLQLGRQSGATIWDDKHRDPIVKLAELSRMVNPDRPMHFITVHDGVWSGYIGAVVDVYDIAFIDGIALKPFQRFYPASSALHDFCKYLFEHGIVKARARLGTFNKPAEIVCRAVGFTKEGISKGEVIFNGRRVSLLELALFPEQLRAANKVDIAHWLKKRK